MKDFPNVKSKVKKNNLAQLGGPNSEAPKRNHFYELNARGEVASSPDVVTYMLQVFCINVYTLLDLGATIYFATTWVARKFYLLPDVLIEPFSICTQWVT